MPATRALKNNPGGITAHRRPFDALQPPPWFGWGANALVCSPVYYYFRQYHQLPANQASDYFRESGDRFEDYAAERFPRLLNERRVGDLALLSAVAYVGTRGVPGYTDKLQEIFTTRYTGTTGETIQAACLDALIATTDNRTATARFLACVGSQPDPPPGRRLCVDGLQRLQPEATEELLAYLARSTDGSHRRRLATLIQRVTRTPSPQPLRFWKDVQSAQAIRSAVQTWREKLVAVP